MVHIVKDNNIDRVYNNYEAGEAKSLANSRAKLAKSKNII